MECSMNCTGECVNNLIHCTIDILATKDCNNHCYYCIQGEHPSVYFPKNKISDLLKFIDNFRKHNENTINNYSIMLFGGEPLLNTSLCNEIMDYCYNNFISLTLITNGFLIPKYMDKLKKLSNRNLLNNLQVSYDGQPNHDLYRCNTAKQVLDTIKLLRDNAIHTICIKSTIPLEGIKNIYDCYIDCIENLNLSYVPTFDYRYNSLNDTKEIYNYIEILKEQMMKIAKYSLENKVWPNTDLFNLNSNLVCSAGRYYFAIDQNLNVSKCHQTAYDNSKEHIIGNILDNDINDRLDKMFDYHKAMDFVMADECRTCESTFCKRCCANNFNVSKKTEYLDKWYDKNSNNLCLLYKEVTKVAKAFNYMWKNKK